MTVTIGIDPHKRSHTAAALDEAEELLGVVRVEAGPHQLGQLLAFAAAFAPRRFAVEGADGLGLLLAQQLLAAGETVLDVPPKLAARARLLGNRRSAKNDANDSVSVAAAAMRSPLVRPAAPEDATVVLKLWARRSSDLARDRTRLVNRLHALLAELVPGGAARRLTADRAQALLEGLGPQGTVGAARLVLAGQLLDELRHLDGQLAQAKAQLKAAVAASGSSLTGLYGVGPFVAATVLGEVGDVARFTDRAHFAAYNGTAPVEVSSGDHRRHRLSMRGNRRLNHALHIAAVAQARAKGGPGRAYYDRKRAEGKSHKEALRALKRRLSDAVFVVLQADASRAEVTEVGPGGQAGNGSMASVAGSHPEHRLFGEATPGPVATLEPQPPARPRPSQHRPKETRQAS